MSESSTAPDVNARKTERIVLQRLAKMSVEEIARVLNKSIATATRVRSGSQCLTVYEWCALFEHGHLQANDASACLVDESIYRGVCAITAKAMANPNIAQMILAEGE